MRSYAEQFILQSNDSYVHFIFSLYFTCAAILQFVSGARPTFYEVRWTHWQQSNLQSVLYSIQRWRLASSFHRNIECDMRERIKRTFWQRTRQTIDIYFMFHRSMFSIANDVLSYFDWTLILVYDVRLICRLNKCVYDLVCVNGLLIESWTKRYSFLVCEFRFTHMCCLCTTLCTPHSTY